MCMCDVIFSFLVGCDEILIILWESKYIKLKITGAHNFSMTVGVCFDCPSGKISCLITGCFSLCFCLYLLSVTCERMCVCVSTSDWLSTVSCRTCFHSEHNEYNHSTLIVISADRN